MVISCDQGLNVAPSSLIYLVKGDVDGPEQ